jgi:outer membrane protein assembly factor BamA
VRRDDLALAFVDHAAIHRLAALIVDAFRSQGYRGVTVAPAVRAGAGASKIVQFVIAPGARTVLGKVTFVGLSAAREAAMRKLLTVVASAPISSEDADREYFAVGTALLEQGLLASKVTYRLVEVPNSATVDLVIEVAEGDVFTFGAIRVIGPRARDARAYATSLAPLQRGAIARPSALREARAAIEALHAGNAPAVTLTLQTKVDTARRVLDVDYVVE